MKTVIKGRLTVFVLLLFIVGLFENCASKKHSRVSQDDRWHDTVYIDSIIVKMPRISILSKDLLKMIDSLLVEKNKYESLNDFPNYSDYITVSALANSSNSIFIDLGKNYIMPFLFPGSEDNNHSYPNVYPLVPTKIGMTKYKGISIVYNWTMESFSFDKLGNDGLIKIENDSLVLNAYALRKKKNNEWIYLVTPNLSLKCDIHQGEILFKGFDYYDGKIQHRR